MTWWLLIITCYPFELSFIEKKIYRVIIKYIRTIIKIPYLYLNFHFHFFLDVGAITLKETTTKKQKKTLLLFCCCEYRGDAGLIYIFCFFYIFFLQCNA